MSEEIKEVETTSSETESEPTDKVESHQKKRKRLNPILPALSYEESLIIANSIWQYASGQKIRRLTLFDFLEKSPDSGPSRTLVTSSSKYGLTSGGYQAEFLELTQDGHVATNPEESPRNKVKANFKLAIGSIEYLNRVYENYKDAKLPSHKVMVDYLVEQGLELEDSKKCIELFLNNARFIGLIKVLSGSERILTMEHLLDEINEGTPVKPAVHSTSNVKISVHIREDIENEWSKTCFYITPIGLEGSEERKHSDLFLGSIVEPAIEEFGLSVVRADKINKAGLITSQVIEHIVKSCIVIADLSFINPNVFYELSLRHSLNLPTVHLIRKQDKIPFDIQDFRTITIDTTDIYTLVPRLESYRTEISRQIRQLLEHPETMENPISLYLEKLKKK